MVFTFGAASTIRLGSGSDNPLLIQLPERAWGAPPELPTSALEGLSGKGYTYIINLTRDSDLLTVHGDSACMPCIHVFACVIEQLHKTCASLIRTTTTWSCVLCALLLHLTVPGKMPLLQPLS